MLPGPFSRISAIVFSPRMTWEMLNLGATPSSTSRFPRPRSASRMMTFFPSWLSAKPRLATMLVFPTPPLPLVMATTRVCGFRRRPVSSSGAAGSAARQRDHLVRGSEHAVIRKQSPRSRSVSGRRRSAALPSLRPRRSTSGGVRAAVPARDEMPGLGLGGRSEPHQVFGLDLAHPLAVRAVVEIGAAVGDQTRPGARRPRARSCRHSGVRRLGRRPGQHPGEQQLDGALGQVLGDARARCRGRTAAAGVRISRFSRLPQVPASSRRVKARCSTAAPFQPSTTASSVLLPRAGVQHQVDLAARQGGQRPLHLVAPAGLSRDSRPGCR